MPTTSGSGTTNEGCITSCVTSKEWSPRPCCSVSPFPRHVSCTCACACGFVCAYVALRLSSCAPPSVSVLPASFLCFFFRFSITLYREWNGGPGQRRRSGEGGGRGCVALMALTHPLPAHYDVPLQWCASPSLLAEERIALAAISERSTPSPVDRCAVSLSPSHTHAHRHTLRGLSTSFHSFSVSFLFVFFLFPPSLCL